LNDRETIFKSILPEEKFEDRRINKIENIEPESESDPEEVEFIETYEERKSQISQVAMSSVASRTMNEIVSKRESLQSMGSRVSTQRAHLKSNGGMSSDPLAGSLSNFTKNYVGEVLDKAAFQGGYGEI